MRTVTNYYIVNLAVADFLVILICLPPTAIMDLTKKWIFNDIMCKVVRYSQVSVFPIAILKTHSPIYGFMDSVISKVSHLLS